MSYAGLKMSYVGLILYAGLVVLSQSHKILYAGLIFWVNPTKSSMHFWQSCVNPTKSRRIFCLPLINCIFWKMKRLEGYTEKPQTHPDFSKTVYQVYSNKRPSHKHCNKGKSFISTLFLYIKCLYKKCSLIYCFLSCIP